MRYNEQQMWKATYIIDTKVYVSKELEGNGIINHMCDIILS